MKIKLSSNIRSYWINWDSYYSMQSQEKFLKYFFPEILNVSITEDDNYDAIVYDIQEDKIIKNNEFNILLCVENCPERSDCEHYNKYNNYDDKRIKIYFYNHIIKCEFKEEYISIPTIYLQMNYFLDNFSYIKPTNLVPFEEKKFCLIATTLNNAFNNIIRNKKRIINDFLNDIENCDYISMYKSEIEKKSCYHDIILLNIFNKYKFVFVCENSINDGYITEKIFNCFFSRTIPIYTGSDKIKYFFNERSFIDINNIDKDNLNMIKEQIKQKRDNKELYEQMLNEKIVSEEYDDENYKIKWKEYIDNRLEKSSF